jgi:hypothetical protein
MKCLFFPGSQKRNTLWTVMSSVLRNDPGRRVYSEMPRSKKPTSTYNVVKVQPNIPTLAVDSGRDWGWALVAPDPHHPDAPAVLLACGLRKLSWPLPVTPTRLVVEQPHLGQSRATKKDLRVLALRAGEVAGRLGERLGLEVVEYVEPNWWKRGSVEKEVMNERVRQRLSASESVLAGKNHNVLDAIGIALFCVGRI